MIICFVLGIAFSLITSQNNSKEMDDRLYFNWKNFKFFNNKKNQMKKINGIINNGIDLQNDSEIEINSFKQFELSKF